MTARLTGSREIAPNTRHFDFEALDWDGVFTPGQFLSVIADIAGEEITRAYSIASAPDGPRFAFCANLVPDGRFSPHLFALAPGGELKFTGPWGSFVQRSTPTPVIYVATGTGIAPFRSMLRSDSAESRPTTLVFGVRHEEGLLYNDEWSKHAMVDYRPTLTRPTEGWQGRSGRVHTHVLEALQERPDADIYVCGLREMVDELRTLLKATGLDRKRIIAEKYD